MRGMQHQRRQQPISNKRAMIARKIQPMNVKSVFCVKTGMVRAVLTPCMGYVSEPPIQVDKTPRSGVPCILAKASLA